MPDGAREIPTELLRALASLAEPPGPEHHRLAEVLGLSGAPGAAEYSDVFLFQLYPYASVHLGVEGMMGGDTRDRVAGFWSALGLTPPAEADHLSALLALYASLADDERRCARAEAVLVGEARAALLLEHIASWAFPYLDRVGELTTGVYAEWAGLLSDVLRTEVAACGGAGWDLPRHLRDASGLADPRVEGGAPFTQGLLSPVRTGMIVTRADLARIAGDLDLGLRAGERRYALDHLLGQDTAGVLRALSDEACRQGARHVTRSAWLGATADWHARRAQATGDLLAELATDSGALVNAAEPAVTLS